MTNRIKNAHGRIATKFVELRARDEAALIPYIVAGDPDLDRTRQLVLELEARGADLIELGVPFSDPMADGPANQRAAGARPGRGRHAAGDSLDGRRSAQKHADSADPVRLLQPDFPLRLRSPLRRRRARRNRRLAGGRSAARGSAGTRTAGARRRPRYHLPARADYAAGTQPHDRAIRERLSLLCLGRRRDRRARPISLTIWRRTSATCAPLPTCRSASASAFRPPRQAREVATFADAVVVGSAISQLIEAHAHTDRLVEIVGEFAGALKDGDAHGAPVRGAIATA